MDSAGSNSPEAAAFTKALVQEGSNEARAQAGNYQQQDNGPDAQNSYNLNASPGAETSSQEIKNTYPTRNLPEGTTKGRMEDSDRAVPSEILKYAIAHGSPAPDPKGDYRSYVLYYYLQEW